MVKKQLCKSNLPVKGSKNRNAHFPIVALSPIVQIANIMLHSSK